MGLLGRNKHDKASNGDNAEENHVGSALLRPISKESTSNSGDTAKDIRRDSHELRLVVRVSHVLDNGREEKRDRVQRSVDTYDESHLAAYDERNTRITNGDQHVHVNLPVLESIEQVLDVIFIGKA